MEILKLTSIRLSKSVLAKAAAIADTLGIYQSSNVIRLAIWVGLKVVKPGVLHILCHMMWEEEEKGIVYSVDDVLRAAGVKLENLKSLE